MEAAVGKSGDLLTAVNQGAIPKLAVAKALAIQWDGFMIEHCANMHLRQVRIRLFDRIGPWRLSRFNRAFPSALMACSRSHSRRSNE
jgi:hypothetical protein